MKNLALMLLFFGPFIMTAQEPAKENKTNNGPPGTQKSISEKGIKGRGLTPKKSSDESTPAPPANTTEEQKTEQTPQDDPKNKEKEKKDPKTGTTSEKSISEKGISSTKKKRSVSKSNSKDKPAPTNSPTPKDSTKKNN